MSRCCQQRRDRKHVPPEALSSPPRLRQSGLRLSGRVPNRTLGVFGGLSLIFCQLIFRDFQGLFDELFAVGPFVGVAEVQVASVAEHSEEM